MKLFLRRHRHRLALGLLGLLLLAVFGGWLAPEHPLAAWHRAVEAVMERLRLAPFPLFLLLAALLPLAGFPVVALYLAAGVIYSPLLGLPATLGGIALSLLLNLLLSHWISRVFHGPVQRLLQRFKVPMPTFGSLPAWKVVLLVRITPGAPLVMQNYLLGLMRTPLVPFIAVSLPVEILIAWGYMAAGKSVATGQWGWLAGGIGMVAFAVLGATLIRDHLRAKNPAE